MNTILMNSENSKTSDPQRLLLNLSDKTNLKRSDRYVALSNFSIYDSWKKYKKVKQKQYVFKISLQNIMWNQKFELPERLNFLSDIQESFDLEYMLEYVLAFRLEYM